MSIYLSLFRHDHTVALFLSWPIMITEGSYQMLMFCEMIYAQQEMPRPTFEFQVSSQSWGAASLPPPLTVSTGFLLVWSSELAGKIHNEFPIPSFCVFFLFSLGELYASRWTPFCSILPRFPICEAERHSSICQLSTFLGNDKVCSAVHVLQKYHINKEYWLSQGLSADASKLRKGSAFWKASQDSSPYTVNSSMKQFYLQTEAYNIIISGIFRAANIWHK